MHITCYYTWHDAEHSGCGNTTAVAEKRSHTHSGPISVLGPHTLVGSMVSPAAPGRLYVSLLFVSYSNLHKRTELGKCASQLWLPMDYRRYVVADERNGCLPAWLQLLTRTYSVMCSDFPIRLQLLR